MAARQDQTLQIFLIVFIFAFLVSAVVAYLGWKGYSDAEQRAAGLQTSLSGKELATQNQQTEIEDLREMMGFGRSDNAPDVKAAFDADMKTMGAGIADEESRSYRKVLETVYAEAQNTAKREADLKEQMNNIAKRLQAVESEKEAQVAQADAARKKAEADAATQRNEFAEDRAELEKTKQELQKNLDQQRANYEGQITQRDTRIKELEGKVTKLEDAVERFKEQRKDEPGSFEIADGRISWVNQDGTVWINLGTADSLRRQVTFSVYDADQHDAAKATKKGSIEVTRVLGEHMAEARVTQDSATDPIIVGDQIYSQVWHRGKKLRFALTGIIDFDGDGQSDMQLARELIELNGGIVDAYLNDVGEVQGEITANTRYLVLGDAPELATQVKQQAGWNSMSQTASSLGVENITVQEFLNQMGYKPQDRKVTLGAGASAREFPARPEVGVSPTSAPRVRARTPYRAPAVSPK
ncbi:MAG: hypothetical protein WD738_17515 [Pirellulales bacterium]